MNYRKVFFSYSSLDIQTVEVFQRSLRAIGGEPFMAEQFMATGQNLPDEIAEHIRDSNAFVPFITRNGLTNQWVNQEIGYAYGWMGQQGIDEPYIFPVVESGLGNGVRGFLGVPNTEYIELMMPDGAEAIYKLLAGLRKYVDRNWQVFGEITITCPTCKREFTRNIPSQRDIDEAIRLKESLESNCKICERRVMINSHTLLAEGTASGHRWS